MINDVQKNRFSELCLKYAGYEKEATGIGTYNEKRLHKIIKEFVCTDGCHAEVKVGGYIADVMSDGHITEIQTGGFYPLADKVKYYLSHTDCDITVISPLITEKRIIRADRESGEIKSCRRSPKRETPVDMLREIFWLSDFVSSERLKIRFFLITTDEYRFSEKVRHRRSGAYDSDLFPTGLCDIVTFENSSDYASVLPSEIRNGGSFCAADFGRELSLHGRAVYSSLHILCAAGAVESCGKSGRKTLYKMKII